MPTVVEASQPRFRSEEPERVCPGQPRRYIPSSRFKRERARLHLKYLSAVMVDGACNRGASEWSVLTASAGVPSLVAFYHFRSLSRRGVEEDPARNPRASTRRRDAKSVLAHVLQRAGSVDTAPLAGQPRLTWRRPEKLASSRSSPMPRQKPRGETGLF
ncbi:hypothetical protein HPB50_017189 [Hyalomma asiaticum]|uniref:Uncharacterized protein n=1 Tax=Hyalomma asiaticum TaxID=266040 RepID=A0ACB7TP54_HYAAI|nr:hypothetical protein HPB50_017189 [Hyalomma asiaticum]